MVTKMEKALARMTDMEHQTIEKDFFGQIYGGIGSGKTVLGVTLAQELREDGRVLFVDSSDGWVTLDTDKHKHLKKGVTHYPYTTPQELGDIAGWIKGKAKGFDDISVVIIDEATSISSSLITQAQRERLGIGPDDPIPGAPEWADYFPAGEILFQIIETFHSTDGLHVILVSHDQYKSIKRGDVTLKDMLMPDFNPKLNSKINKGLHVSAHLTAAVKKAGKVVTYERSLQCLPTYMVEAKSRVSGLELTETPKHFVTTIGDWIFGGAIEEDLTKPERDEIYDDPELTADTLSAEGISAEEDEGILVTDE